jgi:hypothetical protein
MGKSFGIYEGNSRKEDGKRNLNKILNTIQKYYHEKTKKFTVFLKESGFCSFHQYEKTLQDAENQKLLDSTLNFFVGKQDEFFKRKEFQVKFAEMVQECFEQEISMVNQLDLKKVMQYFDSYELGKIWTPLEQVLKK